jgi:AcrR family transcriptional regulator
MKSTMIISPLTSRQSRLLDDLLDLFLTKGFLSLTLDGIAAELSCSKRTLYVLADSKEQLAVLVVREFFRRATEQVDSAIARTRAHGRRLTGYLEAVATALSPASRPFTDDVAAFPPAREIYERNTEAAARRVRELIDEGCRAGSFRTVDSAFVAEVVTASMRRITSGELTAATGLSDAQAYRELAKLTLAAVRR